MSYSGKFKDKNNNLHPVTSVLYGTCDTAAATAAKVVTCTDFDALMTGVTIRVKFANANTAASPTVNINSTGAKSVYRFGSTAPVDGNSWNAGEIVELVYDGTSFFMTGADDLSVKQNATDNNLDTEDKTIVGAINEHEGDIGSLKSGFTNLDNEVNGDATVYPYADVITIEDAVPANLAECKVKIEPVQDLHGYDKPWVGGAGKNKLPLTLDGIKAANTSGTWSGNTYTYNDIVYTLVTDNDGNLVKITVNGTTTLRSFLIVGSMSGLIGQEVIMNGGASGGVASYTASGYCLFTGGIGVPQEYDIGSGATFTVSSNGGNVNINVNNTSVSNLDFYPMLRLSTETDATFAPYTNICHISGHTDVDVQRDGKNLAFKKISGYTINANGVIEALATYNIFVGRVKKGQTYTVTKSSDYEVYAFYTTEPSAGSTSYDGSRVTLQEEADYYTIIAPIDGYIAFRTNVGFNNGQLELGSSATDYEPFRGKTYTIALGDTIYGGTVDFDSGVMTVDRKYIEFDGGETETWTKRSGANSYQHTEDLGIIDASSAVTAISNLGRQNFNGAYYGTEFAFGYAESNHVLYVGAPNIENAEDFKTYLSNNHLQIVGTLVTPLTVQLTPQQIQLLKGQNTLTASTGQISVTVNGVSGSIGSLTSDKQDKTDYSLNTTAKTVVGGINELNSVILGNGELLNQSIKMWSSKAHYSSGTNIKYIDFTMPSTGNRVLEGLMFSRWGIAFFKVVNDGNGDVYTTEIEPFCEASDASISISNAGNAVSINTGNIWSTVTIIVISPGQFDDTVVKDITFTARAS